MRITIDIDDVVLSEAQGLSERDGMTLSAALNLLARRGIKLGDSASADRNPSAPLGLQHEVHCIGTVLDRLDRDDEPPSRPAYPTSTSSGPPFVSDR